MGSRMATDLVAVGLQRRELLPGAPSTRSTRSYGADETTVDRLA